MSRRAFALVALTSLLAACSPRAPDPEIIEELRRYDEAYSNLERGMKATPDPLSGELDFRGKSHEQELAQHVMTPETRNRLTRIRERAATAPNAHMAIVSLEEARSVLADEAKRFTAINAYWTSALPAPYWRKYWNDFYTANQEPVASPDPLLLSIEARMRAALERDDFQRAADESQMLPPVLGEALNRAAGNLIESHVDKATFVARRTPCLPGASPNRASGKPRLLPTAELESFYPPRSKRFGVQGTVVLRVKVDRAGCGKQVAIVVGSGVPELDEAALDWFETAQFSAAWQAGGTVQSKMMFKIRFKIEEPISHQSRG